MSDRRETVAEFAKRVGRSTRQVGRDIRDGMPHAKIAGRVTIPVRKLQWRENNRAVEAASVSALTDARTRRELAAAQLEELRLARLQGVTIRVEEAEKLLAASYTRVALKLNALATRLAPLVVGVESVEAAYAIIDRVVDEIRDEIRQLDELPTSTYDDDEPAPTPAGRRAARP